MPKFAQLPEKGRGFTTYSREKDGGDQWGLPDVVCALLYLGNRRAGARADFSVGDMARRSGGKFPGHSSHKTGQDVDLRPIRTDGANQPVQHNYANYNRDETRLLLKDLRRFCKVETILFNDPVLVKEGLCKAYKGHDNHLHVKFAAKQPEAVKWFQREHGLTVDGIAGEKTITALMALRDKKVSRASVVSGETSRQEGVTTDEGRNLDEQPSLPDSAPRITEGGNMEIFDRLKDEARGKADELKDQAIGRVTEAAQEQVQKVTQSNLSKIAAASLPVSGILLKVLGVLTNPWVIGAIILAGAFLWNESKKRQHRTQLALIAAGADRDKNTVAIVPAPPKAE